MRTLTIAAIAALCFALIGCDKDDSEDQGDTKGGSANPPTLTITTTALPTAQVGAAYAAQLDVSGGGQAGYVWSIIGALPGGLGITQSGAPSATLSGTPTAYGVFQFQVQVADSASTSAAVLFTLTVVPPPAPAPPAPPPLPPPPPPSTFYGATASGNLLFLIEVSATMVGAPIANLRAELTSCISALTSADSFDVIVFNDTMQGSYTALWGTQLPATQGNKSAAIAWMNGSATNPAGAADQSTYPALHDSLVNYIYTEQHFLFTYTQPASPGQILADYPSWASQMPNNFEQVVVAKTPAAASWGQDLAALAGGTFVP